MEVNVVDKVVIEKSVENEIHNTVDENGYSKPELSEVDGDDSELDCGEMEWDKYKILDMTNISLEIEKLKIGMHFSSIHGLRIAVKLYEIKHWRQMIRVKNDLDIFQKKCMNPDCIW